MCNTNTDEIVIGNWTACKQNRLNILLSKKIDHQFLALQKKVCQFIQIHVTPRVNLKLNYRLWVIMCQCDFIGL
jgi:hypothetical protein